MNLYELTYLIKPELTSDEVKEFNQELTDELKEANATLYKMEQPKKRNLAYEVKGFTEGYIACIDMDIASEQVKLIEEKLKRKDEILRYLIISKEELEEEEEPKDEEEEPKDEGDDEEEEDKEEDDDEKEEEEDKNKKEDKVKLNEIDEKIDEII
ncbi:MAG: 30S ribosomal protein S6 [Patescibacteria group bacterium]